MNFIQKNYETLLTKMEIAHIHEDKRKDFDELGDGLLGIAECMRLVAERALEKVISAVDTERAAHYSELHKGCPGWDKARYMPQPVSTRCAPSMTSRRPSAGPTIGVGTATNCWKCSRP